MWDAERPSFLTTVSSIKRAFVGTSLESPGWLTSEQGSEPLVWGDHHWPLHLRLDFVEINHPSTHNMYLQDCQTSQLFSHGFPPLHLCCPLFFLESGSLAPCCVAYISTLYIAQTTTLTITPWVQDCPSRCSDMLICLGGHPEGARVLRVGGNPKLLGKVEG